MDATYTEVSLVRAHQRDLIQVSTLRSNAEEALRHWFGMDNLASYSNAWLSDRKEGTRWLSRWDKELDLIIRLSYYGITTGRGKSSHA